MRKKFKDIIEGDKLYIVESSSEESKVVVHTVEYVDSHFLDNSIVVDCMDEKGTPHRHFLPKESTSRYDLLFTTKEEARHGMIRQINHSIEYHESMIEKYKEQLKEFVD